MNLLSLLSLVGFIVSVLLADFVFYKNPRNRLNRLFSITLFSNAAIMLAEFGGRLSLNAADAMIWEYIDALWPLRLGLLMHFVIVLTGRWVNLKENVIKYSLLYGMCAFVFVVYVSALQSANMYGYEWGWFPVFPDEISFMLDGIYTWAAVFSLSSVMVCLAYYYIEEDPLRKHQASFVLAGIAIPAVAALFMDVAFPPTYSTSLPETSLLFTFSSIFVVYAIWRYELFMLTPEKSAQDIVSKMKDSLFLVDWKRRIKMINDASSELLGYDKNELIDKPVETIFTNSEDPKIIFSDYSFTDFTSYFKTKDEKTIPISVSNSVIENKESKKIKGYVLIGREISQRYMMEESLKKKSSGLSYSRKMLEKDDYDVEKYSRAAVERERQMKAKELDRKLKKMRDVAELPA